MELISIKHMANIVVDTYQFAESINKQLLKDLKSSKPISQPAGNVNASMYNEYDWELNNLPLKNLKEWIREKIEKVYRPGVVSSGLPRKYVKNNGPFWSIIYSKGDHTVSHCHKPNDFSFAYFVKTKWYHSPLIFTDSGKKIRPKEGRVVIFPSYLNHHVPKHRYNDKRITLSGNYMLQRTV